MFCPRCGSPNPDATKFCRQCGLALTQLTGYVASGGTASLQNPQPISSNPSNLMAKATDGLTPKQKMVLIILLLAFSPAIFSAFAEATGLGRLGGALASISAVLMPIGIIFTVMRYKAQKRRLEQAQSQMTQPPLHSSTQHIMPPAAPYGLPQPTQQPATPTQNYQQPVYQPPVHQPPSPPPTNPLKGPGSVTEDETRRFQ